MQEIMYRTQKKILVMLFNGYKHPINTEINAFFRFSGRKNGGEKVNKAKTVFIHGENECEREKKIPALRGTDFFSKN
jgi:hypothetical protein